MVNNQWHYLQTKPYYRIRLLIRRGYYLFQHAILRGYYSRAATVRERDLLIMQREATTIFTSEVEEAGSFVDIDDEDELDAKELVWNIYC